MQVTKYESRILYQDMFLKEQLVQSLKIQLSIKEMRLKWASVGQLASVDCRQSRDQLPDCILLPVFQCTCLGEHICFCLVLVFILVPGDYSNCILHSLLIVWVHREITFWNRVKRFKIMITSVDSPGAAYLSDPCAILPCVQLKPA